MIPLDAALGRVLAAPLTSASAVPSWDNSAMDGYAIRHADLAAHDGQLLVTQRIPAGATGVALESGTAARIFTGAPIPAGADTVVVQEICEHCGDFKSPPAPLFQRGEEEKPPFFRKEHEKPPFSKGGLGGFDQTGRLGGFVRIPLDCKAGANIRRVGEDVCAGAEIIAAGTRLTAAHLGLVAAVGVAQVMVYQRLRVAVLTTGDELAQPGEPLQPGQIYNANQFLLSGLLRGLGCEVVEIGSVADTREATIDALQRGAREADLILASGGVSVGEEDHLKPAIEEIGSLELWNINIRPGKPVAFGTIAGTPVLGAPGNPVSLFVTFCLFARPVVLRRQGIVGDLAPRVLKIRAGFDWSKPDKRTEFHRARLQAGADGELEVAVFPTRSSAVLSSLTWADGLIEIAPGRVIASGDLVDFLPFADLLH
ncbi:gephyrin-like molybdotransferase Glp [Chromatium okenii]|uniref:molybdopterin molybdotransferase MoeA n=1 Tax=Chromatium okenii TaxID=61644 RepID=UPI0026F35708|nr:gephyrin-like molybdotransferase Glp [Chromatium okenii]MBV5308324.1 molybdopterin molybdotransferase MoeA [Chromatium okenii]